MKKLNLKKFFGWKVKTFLVAIVLAFVSYQVLTIERDNGQTIAQNWWACKGKGFALERESEYSLIFNECVTIRKNADGTETRVFASLDIGLEGLSE